MMKKLFPAIIAIALAACCPKAPEQGYETNGRWTKQKALEWSQRTGWRSGCDYIPSTAINQIEMWQQSSFDPATIDKELEWAEELGFNTMRVYLSSVVWKHEAEGFKQRIGQFLEIADSHGIRPLFVFFDDCWNPDSQIGEQPAPKPGVHNSGWVRDPSDGLRADTVALYPVLEAYVKDIMTTFKDDERVLWWDLYNEPGNSGYGIKSLPLVKNVFRWAREVRPSQPVSIGLWYYDCPELNEFQVENSDIISYHDYVNPDLHATRIGVLKAFGRPLYCTEYMARRNGSYFQTIMPMLKANNVGAINWGFVAGKTNTIFAWDEPRPDATEPELWFHDIYRTDKTPFDQAEIETIKQTNGVF
jgi:hypothetical protein